MKFCFCQISTNLINKDLPDDIASQYYREFWDKKKDDGYVKPDDFWELPLWVARLSFITRTHDRSLEIIRRVNQTLPSADYYLFSVLEVNKAIIRSIVLANPNKKFIVGGYVDFAYFADCQNVQQHTLESFCESFRLAYSEFTDYSLFSGISCIPRLTLSTGCRNKCRFCTVEKEIKKIKFSKVLQQIFSFRELSFKLIYVNDKTFGQCNNWNSLKSLYLIVKKYNPNFQGFIIQTSCQQTLRFDRQKVNLADYGVFAIELGIETFSDRLLKEYCKPQTARTILQAVDVVSKWGIRLIGNLIIGLRGETDADRVETLFHVESMRHRFYAFNIYNYAVYGAAEVSNEDTDELTVKKSFRTNMENDKVQNFADVLYRTAVNVL